MLKVHKSKLLLTLSLALVFSACEDKLDISPRSSIAPEDVTPADTEVLLTGVYNQFQGNSGPGYMYLSFLADDLAADNLTYRASFFQHQEINDNAVPAGNLLVQYFWGDWYYAVNKANDFINAVQPLPESGFSSPTRKNETLAEARALRAYGYLYLVTHWGGVPIVKEPTLGEIARSSEEDVWKFIIEDLEFAATNAADFSDPNYISKQAAQALLARVYLYRGRYADAARVVSEVIDSNEFSLSASYNSIWTSKENSERIFQLNSTLNDATSMSFFLQTNNFNGGRYELPADPSLYAAYEAGDTRKDVSIVKITPNQGFDLMANKYRSGSYGDDAWPVARIAEMYLIRAEAAANLNQGDLGASDVNEIRSKRGLGNLIFANQAAAKLAIEKERRVELAFEGHRWYDLIRTGRAIDVLPNVTTETQLKWPIPQREIDNNSLLTQNPL